MKHKKSCPLDAYCVENIKEIIDGIETIIYSHNFEDFTHAFNQILRNFRQGKYYEHHKKH